MNKSSSSTIKIALYHVFFWILYVISEYLANYPHLEGAEHLQQIWSVLISLPLLMLPTYIIVLIAVPRYLKKDKLLTFFLIMALSAAFVFYGRIKWLELVNYIFYDFSGSMPASKVIKNVVRDYAIIALATSIYIISDWRQKAHENKRLAEAKAKYELELLKRQLHPHFLFNTLNNIYSLSLKNSDLTGDSILKLAKLLEYLIYQSGEKAVLLADEMALVKNYIALEKLRYGPDLEVNLDISNINDHLKTAPLILLPFVENCFKHGGKNEKEVFWINISLKAYDQLLTIFIENSKSDMKKGPKEKPSGIGLVNIAERLDLLYPNKYELVIEDSQHYYSIKLEIRL